jgi:hypothetical protein
VPEEYRGGYEYWLASNVLEFTSDAYQVNLFDLNSHQEVAAALRKRLIHRMVQAGETAPTIESHQDIISNPMRFVYPEEIDI